MSTQQKEVIPPLEPAQSDEGRIAQLTALAYDAVEKRIREGKASSMELVYFLKLGGERTRLEERKLDAETRLHEAKISSIEEDKENNALYKQTIDALKGYRIDDGDD